jgi:hypothetical protein
MGASDIQTVLVNLLINSEGMQGRPRGRPCRPCDNKKNRALSWLQKLTAAKMQICHSHCKSHSCVRSKTDWRDLAIHGCGPMVVA